ncbi:MAG: Rpp14/Pop5 family protein [Candidatus Bathyarchaeia archaeon]
MPRVLRRRYIGVRVDSESEVDRKRLADAVYDSLLGLFGEFGASLAELRLIDYYPKSKCAIFRCTHKALEMVKASIVAVKEVDGKKASTQIVCVSGTLKALRKKLIP